MRLRYAGACRLCGASLPAGTDAIYEREFKTVSCVECSATPVESDTGVAGASARREHERRKNASEHRIRTNHPKLGGLILALTEDPESTEAWQRGAIGEERLAEWLNELPETLRVLHDRRIPGTRANIDHIVVSPSGVWVIDAKRYKGQRPSLHVEGGIFRPRVETLRVAGRDKTKLVNGVHSQITRVTAALPDGNVDVHGALCFVKADWPLIGGSVPGGACPANLRSRRRYRFAHLSACDLRAVFCG
ncbi:NERD domain-containing protein [Microbacterium saccharophilum]|uniref:NERD domain-containing protein n=2 Tax=Microbacterium saccharophilum TaxID=1213358 RepID=A0A5C8HSV8_9MICO|nr:NERD domain-containing protein [Microbacterium saccharophilum]